MPLKKGINKEEREPPKPENVATKTDTDKPKPLTDTEEQTSTDTKPLKTEEYSSELKQVMIFFRKSKHIKLDIRTNIYITNSSCNLMFKKY